MILQKIKSKGKYPELSIYSILIGYFLGILLAVSIGYTSLILGFSIEGSELAAILGFGLLRGVFKRDSMIENNIVQTIASSVNAASAGLMFSIPALFIMNYAGEFNPTVIAFGGIAGAFLGISFIIPLRKHMIEYERLTYPGGVAIAAILKSPGAGIEKVKKLIYAGILSGIFALIVQGTDLHFGGTGDYLNFSLFSWIGLPAYLNGTWQLSLLTVGIAFIAGRGSIPFVLGGFVCYWLITPLLIQTGMMPLDPSTGQIFENPNLLRSELFRPLGIGMLVGSALLGALLTFPLIFSTIQSMRDSAKTNSSTSRDEMPVSFLYFAVIGAFILLTFLAINSAQKITIFHGLSIAFLGTIWIVISCIILSEAVGRTNWSPLSGMTLIGVTLVIILMSSYDTKTSIVTAISVGGAMAVAMNQATDLMLDLKTGYLLGASPRQQQIAQFLGAWIGPIVVVMLILILDKAYGIGSDRLPSPQAAVLATTIEGILKGDAPFLKYLAGAGIGGLIAPISAGTAVTVALGFYLPFSIILTFSIGIVLRELSNRFFGKEWSESQGIPIAAGLIIGEALVGVSIAMYIVFWGG
jgi:putative OPT family oligopeptide transporter